MRATGDAYKLTCPANTKHSLNVGTTLGHRLRCWPNVVPALSERLVFAGALVLHNFRDSPGIPAAPDLFCNLFRPTQHFHLLVILVVCHVCGWCCLPFLPFTMPKRIIRPPQWYGFEEDDFAEFIFDNGSEDDYEHRPEGPRGVTGAFMY